ncbi:MAG TPA: toll/interleukin-1 receptor domain-containing protein [Candidatus Aquilonibacter sp.]|nr:toll/interleukin-1 receptor domain-containing protein [Candidatus Aquilonibacter sp.]
MSDLFISHVEEDRGIALEIARGVESAGFTTWYYERDCDGGASYLVQTRQAVVDSQAVLLIVSRNSIGSAQVSREVVRAHESNKPIVPLLHEISDVEYKRRQPEWEEAIGAATSLEIPKGQVGTILPRVLRGLKKMAIEPNGSPTITPKAVTETVTPTPSAAPASLKPETISPPVESKRLSPRIVICAILGALGLIGCLGNLIKTASPTGDLALFYQGFPLVQPINLAVNAFNLLTNALLLVGAWMCFQVNPAGFKIVRGVALVILASIAVWIIAVLLTTTTAAAWATVPTANKSALIMNIFLFALLGAVPTGLILFLFRKGR